MEESCRCALGKIIVKSLDRITLPKPKRINLDPDIAVGFLGNQRCSKKLYSPALQRRRVSSGHRAKPCPTKIVVERNMTGIVSHLNSGSIEVECRDERAFFFPAGDGWLLISPREGNDGGVIPEPNLQQWNRRLRDNRRLGRLRVARDNAGYQPGSRTDHGEPFYPDRILGRIEV